MIRSRFNDCRGRDKRGRGGGRGIERNNEEGREGERERSKVSGRRFSSLVFL